MGIIVESIKQPNYYSHNTSNIGEFIVGGPVTIATPGLDRVGCLLVNFPSNPQYNVAFNGYPWVVSY